jgi:hypothetical protein
MLLLIVILVFLIAGFYLLDWLLEERAPHNGSYLQSLRANSCYSITRKAHNVLVILACIGTVLGLIGMLFAASELPYGMRGNAYAMAWGITAGMAAGIFIERALFVAILDAVDVLIDNARQQRERDQQGPKV